MKLDQIHLESLGHASYLLASEDTGEALVLDPRRDVDVYLSRARERGYRIRYALDTHQHNDYLSGLKELTQRAGATALGSAYTTLGYDHEPLKDGQQFELGEIGFEVMHTPGHTPEHLSLLVYDGEQSRSEPAFLLAGGALLVGDLARPDLLGGEKETRKAAQQFCATIQEKLLALPDHVLVYPTHVAGSLCGGSIGSRLVTSVGYERRVNETLAHADDSDGLVENCLNLENLPAVPPYWPRMRQQNANGVAPVGLVDPPPALDADEVVRLRDEEDVIVLDARMPEAFAGGHIPGALNVGLSTSFPTWAGTVLPEGAQTVLVVDDPAHIMEATWDLLRIGYDVPRGWLAGGMRSWRTTGRPLDALATTNVTRIADRLDEFQVLDVRQPDEWAEGHAPEAQLITGASIPERFGEVPTERPVLTVCGSGYRSTVIASYLQREGYENVTNLLGGMTAWKQAGLPTTT